MLSFSILSLIGNTPLLEITKLDRGPCRLFVKLESKNPSGSIKDRIALSMIEAAERAGTLTSGGTIVEATAGNTGAALALVGALRGYKVVLVVLDKMAPATIMQCKALGAEVRLAQSSLTREDPDYYQNIARRIADERGAFFVNQFDNPANPGAHEKSTGPEIWVQMEHKVDAVVCGVGSGGTLAGLGRYFANVSRKTEMILADPQGSILAPLANTGEKVKPGSWQVVGIGEDFMPPNLAADFGRVKKAYSISDEESFQTARDLLREEGISAGLSSGTQVAAALRYCREQTSPKRVVTFICDDGAKYLEKLFG
jgi:cystathionine beta-synthase